MRSRALEDFLDNGVVIVVVTTAGAWGLGGVERHCYLLYVREICCPFQNFQGRRSARQPADR